MNEYDIETPALRVNVYKHGRRVAQVLCESAEDAADAVAQWDDVDGIECEVEDLATGHGVADVRAPEPDDLTLETIDDAYRRS